MPQKILWNPCNLFLTKVPFLYFLKTQVFWCFERVKNGKTGQKKLSIIFLKLLNRGTENIYAKISISPLGIWVVGIKQIWLPELYYYENESYELLSGLKIVKLFQINKKNIGIMTGTFSKGSDLEISFLVRNDKLFTELVAMVYSPF